MVHTFLKMCKRPGSFTMFTMFARITTILLVVCLTHQYAQGYPVENGKTNKFTDLLNPVASPTEDENVRYKGKEWWSYLLSSKTTEATTTTTTTTTTTNSPQTVYLYLNPTAASLDSNGKPIVDHSVHFTFPEINNPQHPAVVAGLIHLKPISTNPNAGSGSSVIGVNNSNNNQDGFDEDEDFFIPPDFILDPIPTDSSDYAREKN